MTTPPRTTARTDPFLARVVRESLWFALLIAYYLGARGLGRPVQVGYLVGVGVMLVSLLAFDRALGAQLARLLAARRGLGDAEATEPSRSPRPYTTWAAVALLPVLAVVLGLAVLRWEASPVAIPAGMATPAVVALLKLVGQAWGRWAKEYGRSGGPPEQGGESER